MRFALRYQYGYMIIISIFLIFFLPACSLISSINIQKAAENSFEEWAQLAGVPYKDVEIQVSESDEAFATVYVRAYLRETAQDDWLEKEAAVDCRKIGSEWQCSTGFVFVLTEREQSRQVEILSATAAAQNSTPGTEFPNVAEGKPTRASSYWRGAPDHSFPSSAIVDRNTVELSCMRGVEEGNSYWLLESDQTGWVEVDLLRNYSIIKIRWLNTHNGPCMDRTTTRYHFSFSQTGEFSGEEEIVHRGTMTLLPNPQYEELIFTDPKTARYVRFYVDDYHNEGGGLNELEVYTGDGSP